MNNCAITSRLKNPSMLHHQSFWLRFLSFPYQGLSLSKTSSDLFSHHFFQTCQHICSTQWISWSRSWGHGSLIIASLPATYIFALYFSIPSPSSDAHHKRKTRQGRKNPGRLPDKTSFCDKYFRYASSRIMLYIIVTRFSFFLQQTKQKVFKEKWFYVNFIDIYILKHGITKILKIPLLKIDWIMTCVMFPVHPVICFKSVLCPHCQARVSVLFWRL